MSEQGWKGADEGMQGGEEVVYIFVIVFRFFLDSPDSGGSGCEREGQGGARKKNPKVFDNKMQRNAIS